MKVASFMYDAVKCNSVKSLGGGGIFTSKWISWYFLYYSIHLKSIEIGSLMMEKYGDFNDLQ